MTTPLTIVIFGASGDLTARKLVPSLYSLARKDRLPRVLGGMGVAILSTSNGLITSRTAQEQGVGGEVICFIW